MGPKKEKKKKKSKAELEQERIDREIAEEKEAQERARRLEEQREREREEAQRLKEAQKATRVEELMLLSGEANEEAGVLETRRAAIDALRDARAEARAWEHYKDCAPLPTGEDDRELNTYVSEVEDEARAADGEAGLDAALEAIAEAEAVARALEGVKADALARGDLEAADKASGFLARLRDVAVERLDRATAGVLRKADESAAKNEDPEKKDVYVMGSDVLAAEAKENRALNVQQTPRSPKRPPPSVDARKPSHGNLLSPQPEEEAPPGAHPATRVGIWANTAVKPIRGPFKQLGFDDIRLHVDLPKALGTQRLGARIVAMPAEHVAAKLRGSAAKARAAMEAPARELLPGSQMLVLGGCLHLEVLELPPPPREIKPKWRVRPVERESGVKAIPFPPLSSDGTAPPFVYSKQPPAPNQYLRAKVRMPADVVVPGAEALRVAWWDAVRGAWVDGSTYEVAYNKTRREVSFSATRAGALAIVQPRTLDLPYASWCLEPALPVAADGASEAEEACCRLTLETPRFTLVIECRADGSCTLLKPDLEELGALREAPTSPGRLIAALARAGVHLAPDDADATAMEREPKHAAVEAKLCEEVAALAAGFDFRECPAAADLGADRCGVRVRETSCYVGGGARALDHKTLLVENDAASKSARDAPGVGELPAPGVKCAVVMGGESFAEHAAGQKPAFDESCAPGASSHIFLSRCLKEAASEEAFERVAAAPLEFQQAVQELLHLTRPFSFS